MGSLEVSYRKTDNLIINVVFRLPGFPTDYSRGIVNFNNWFVVAGCGFLIHKVDDLQFVSYIILKFKGINTFRN